MKQRFVAFFFCLLVSVGVSSAQEADAAKVERGSKTAKAGFQNEDEIRDKFNNWKTDADARSWLEAMNHQFAEITSVSASKPHGEKADVEVTVKTQSGERVERISIKLVSSANGFNQIDKRWLKTYEKMWKMPPGVVESLKLFVGETPPHESSRDKRRMYLNELDENAQQAVLDFFKKNKDEIVSDLLAGDGIHAANWMMVIHRPNSPTRSVSDGESKTIDQSKWVIKSTADAIKFYSDGPVELTKAGNLKIGRITLQRKGGDNGRETAKMLQFKINPVQLFDAKSKVVQGDTP
ncbi:MAG: type II restriction endonuclease [Planctomycetia bacterium]|nr:type II restriction endonuclease [Planctomycetia bacterium]